MSRHSLPRTRWNLLSHKVTPGDMLLAGLSIIGGLLLLATTQPRIEGDGDLRLEALRQILAGTTFPDSKYSLLQPYSSIPLILGDRITGLDYAYSVAYFNLVLSLVCLPAIGYLIARKSNATLGLTSVLVLITASMLPHHLQHYYGEVLSAEFLVLAILLPRRWWSIQVVLAALAVLNTPALLPAVGLASLAAAVIGRRWYPLLAPLTAAALVALETVAKYGSLQGSPYLAEAERGFRTVMPYSGEPGFSYPLFFGVLSILFSFGKGLVFFTPGLLLVFNSSVRRFFKGFFGPAATAAVVVFSVALIATYAQWWAWYGGGFWGPRFFLVLSFLASFLLAIALWLPREVGQSQLLGSTLVVLVALLALWVGINGFVFGQSGMDICWANDYALEHLCWFTPEFGALWRPFVVGDSAAFFDTPRSIYAGFQVVVMITLIASYLRRRPVSGSPTMLN